MARNLLQMGIASLTVWQLSYKMATFELFVFFFFYAWCLKITSWAFALHFRSKETTSENKIFLFRHFVFKMSDMQFSTLQVF